MPFTGKPASSWRTFWNIAKGRSGPWRRSWSSWRRCSGGWGSEMRIGSCLQAEMTRLSGDFSFFVLRALGRWGWPPVVFSTEKRAGGFSFGCQHCGPHHAPRAAAPDALRRLLMGRPRGGGQRCIQHLSFAAWQLSKGCRPDALMHLLIELFVVSNN